MFQKKNKYGAIKVSRAGISFASKLEAALYEHLKLLEMAGEIKIEKIQDHVYLSRARIGYIPDFRIYDRETKSQVWCEAKGFETERWPVVKKLWKAYGPGPLRIYKGSYKSLALVEEIIPNHSMIDD